jgi:hypothetical protein
MARHIIRRSAALIWRCLCLVVGLMSLQTAALAGDPAIGPREFNLFVALEGSTQVLSVDPDLLQIVGSFDVGVVPRDLAVSAPLKELVAADGTSPSIRAIDLDTGEPYTLALPFVPTRVLLAPDGLRIAAIDGHEGTVVILDLHSRSVIAHATDFGPVDEALFSGDSTRLLLADSTRAGIRVLEVETGQSHVIEEDRVFAALARAPNGREGFGKPRGVNAVELLDLRNARAGNRIAVTAGVDSVFVSGSGRFLLLPDGMRQELSIASTETWQVVATLHGGTDIEVAYSAWFDTVALASSASERKLYIYDLDRLAFFGALALAGTPGSGIVGTGGDKLFIPTTDANAIEVIDAAKGRLASVIPLAGRPVALAMAGGYGVCH